MITERQNEIWAFDQRLKWPEHCLKEEHLHATSNYTKILTDTEVKTFYKYFYQNVTWHFDTNLNTAKPVKIMGNNQAWYTLNQVTLGHSRSH